EDQDARQRCQASLERLRDFLNRAERSLEPSRLRTELEHDLKWADGIISKHGTPEQKRRFQILRDEAQRAIASGDALLMPPKDGARQRVVLAGGSGSRRVAQSSSNRASDGGGSQWGLRDGGGHVAERRWSGRVPVGFGPSGSDQSTTGTARRCALALRGGDC